MGTQHGRCHGSGVRGRYDAHGAQSSCRRIGMRARPASFAL
ncbi:hypothetical protein PATSB16_22440 [Pandoraea thiooxydans]|nr:hypothetical protein PATSB16_22440 [Pandoraea thiooxydans]